MICPPPIWAHGQCNCNATQTELGTLKTPEREAETNLYVQDCQCASGNTGTTLLPADDPMNQGKQLSQVSADLYF